MQLATSASYCTSCWTKWFHCFFLPSTAAAVSHFSSWWQRDLLAHFKGHTHCTLWTLSFLTKLHQAYSFFFFFPNRGVSHGWSTKSGFCDCVPIHELYEVWINASKAKQRQPFYSKIFLACMHDIIGIIKILILHMNVCLQQHGKRNHCSNRFNLNSHNLIYIAKLVYKPL